MRRQIVLREKERFELVIFYTETGRVRLILNDKGSDGGNSVEGLIDIHDDNEEVYLDTLMRLCTLLDILTPNIKESPKELS